MELENYGTHLHVWRELPPTHSWSCHQPARLYEKVMKCGALIYCSVTLLQFLLFIFSKTLLSIE